MNPDQVQHQQADGGIGVFVSISNVMAALAKEGISKGRRNEQQGYAFRGIDDVYNTLASMLSAEGLVILPRCLSREVTERQTRSGAPLFYVCVDVEFTFVSARDGSRVIVRMPGEAMDSADKATNKAMSAAYKYACLQTFCIPTEGDNDADQTTHAPASKTNLVPKQASAGQDAVQSHVLVGEAEVKAITDLAAKVGTDVAKISAAYNVPDLTYLMKSDVPEIIKKLQAKVQPEKGSTK